MRYDNDTCNKFAEECKAAGFEVEHYRGRFYWEGPAVRCENVDYQTVCRATSMPLQSDSMGLGIIMYPVRSGKLMEEAE